MKKVDKEDIIIYIYVYMYIYITLKIIKEHYVQVSGNKFENL